MLLKESERGEAWLATAVCIILTCFVICYTRVKETWNTSVMWCIMGGFGLIQLIILPTIEIPSYWEDNPLFIRMCAAGGFQPVIYLLGYCISKAVEKRYELAANTLIYQLLYRV